MVSQNMDNDSISVTSSNVHMELLTSRKTPSSGNGSVLSESEDTHTSSSVKKDKKHKEKVDERLSKSDRWV